MRRHCRQMILGLAVLAFAGAASAQLGPIFGPDNFEPDDEIVSLSELRWVPMFDEGNSVHQYIRHNFDRPDDVDWSAFLAPPDLFCFARTAHLFSQADTVIGVYQLLQPGESFPPLLQDANCGLPERYALPNGYRIALIACNDDIIGVTGRASEVQFDTDSDGGIYFMRISSSPKAVAQKEGPSGPETTYSAEVTYFGVVAGSLFASVYDSETLVGITGAKVDVQPLGMTITENEDGVYGIGAVAEGTYQLRVEAPNYAPQTISKFVSGGGFTNYEFPLVKTPLRHSADYNSPAYKVSLAELLRAIQFYNIGSFHCDPYGEDDYNPGGGGHGCKTHDSDYNPQDWKISLAELLRLIQFYNSPSYAVCEGSEDGFCPG